MFYLVAYGFTVIAAFGVVTLVRDADGEATHLSRWAGLGRRSPLFAALFTFLLLAFAGIPLTSGFTGKFAVFGGGDRRRPDLAGDRRRDHQHDPRLPVPAGRRDDVAVRAGRDDARRVSIPGALTAAALMIGVLATLLLGVVPAARCST